MKIQLFILLLLSAYAMASKPMPIQEDAECMACEFLVAKQQLLMDQKGFMTLLNSSCSVIPDTYERAKCENSSFRVGPHLLAAFRNQDAWDVCVSAKMCRE